MKYYLIAGEASGDLHGSHLIQSILQRDNSAEIRFWGGDKMSAATHQEPVMHIRDLAYMGFIEVLSHLHVILRNIKFCKQDIEAFQPDVVVFIDYPGFNLRIAEWCKNRNYKTVYYISPQIWAWKENRIKKIKKNIDKMIVILPFEKDFYKKHQMHVTFVGHPLADIIDSEKENPVIHIDSDQPIIALLPGSRKQEIRKMLPRMAAVTQHYPEYNFYIATAPNISQEFYSDILMNHSDNIFYAPVSTYQLLRQSKAALVTSGTATLEVALLEVPEIVCYIGHPLSVWLAKKLIKIKFISLVNLILDKPAVKELIQDEMNTQNIRKELTDLLSENSKRHIDIMNDYKSLKKLLSNQGASYQAAHIICTFAEEDNDLLR